MGLTRVRSGSDGYQYGRGYMAYTGKYSITYQP
jgi:hypothetical protein